MVSTYNVAIRHLGDTVCFPREVLGARDLTVPRNEKREGKKLVLEVKGRQLACNAVAALQEVRVAAPSQRGHRVCGFELALHGDWRSLERKNQED
jgi:hypothetical protein